jgi:hypothetical protein
MERIMTSCGKLSLIFVACCFAASSAFAGFLEDVGRAVTAPITAPLQATRDVLRGAPPSQIIQNQYNAQVIPQVQVMQNAAQIVQAGHNFVMSVPRDAIQRNLGGDWVRGYDFLTASQRVQYELAFTSGRYLGRCLQAGQCGINQLAAMPVAAAMRDAYKVYVTYSYPLDPNVLQILNRVVPPQVLYAARWSIGNTPDMTVPGFLNAGYTAFGNGHAVTLGNVMIFSQMPDLSNGNGWVWLLHELFHIEQYMRYSSDALESIDGFAVDYVNNYQNMESEAQNNAVARYNQLLQF